MPLSPAFRRIPSRRDAAAVALSLVLLAAPRLALAQAAPAGSPGFDALRRAAALMVDGAAVGAAVGTLESQQKAGHVYTLDEKKRLVAENAPALAAARQALQLPFRNPDLQGIRALIPWALEFRSLGRLIVLAGDVEAAEADYSGAADDCLLAIRLGRESFINGLYVESLTGAAIEQIARRPLWDMAEHVDAATSRHIAETLMSEQAQTPEPGATIQTEGRTAASTIPELFHSPDQLIDDFNASTNNAISTTSAAALRSEAAQGSESVTLATMTHYYEQCAAAADVPARGEPTLPAPPPGDFYLDTLATLIPSFVHKSIANHAQNSLLAAFYGLRAYDLDHHAYPPTLAALVPTELARVPSDPFDAGLPVRYKRAGAAFLLYSVGPDGVDNGGEPLSVDPRGSAVSVMSSTGDIVAQLDPF